jgi:hydrogenase maturation protease
MSGPGTDTKVLMIGIGNNGRGDDAMGWMFIDQVAGLTSFETEYRYQLQIEDAALIGEYDIVIFVDASMKKIKNGFSFKSCTPVNQFSFSTHRIEPGSILWLCRELYGKLPAAYVMAIEGTHWELHQGLSIKAQQNFDKAILYFKNWMNQHPVADSWQLQTA